MFEVYFLELFFWGFLWCINFWYLSWLVCVLKIFKIICLIVFYFCKKCYVGGLYKDEWVLNCMIKYK